MIAVIDYGAGNLRSVEFALDRLGVEYRRAATPDRAGDAAGVILPGVGAAASAMRRLEASGWADELGDPGSRARSVPLLGICLGMQLLFDSSDEGGRRTGGLGVMPGRVRRFGWDVPGRTAGLAVPHMGWNSVRARADESLFGESGRTAGGEEYFYFLHSFRTECAAEFVAATVTYGEAFPAAVRSGRISGVQFHPEKSGPAGARVLRAFCAECGAC